MMMMMMMTAVSRATDHTPPQSATIIDVNRNQLDLIALFVAPLGILMISLIAREVPTLAKPRQLGANSLTCH
jgi:hypothetical protein